MKFQWQKSFRTEIDYRLEIIIIINWVLTARNLTAKYVLSHSSLLKTLSALADTLWSFKTFITLCFFLQLSLSPIVFLCLTVLLFITSISHSLLFPLVFSLCLHLSSPLPPPPLPVVLVVTGVGRRRAAASWLSLGLSTWSLFTSPT